MNTLLVGAGAGEDVGIEGVPSGVADKSSVPINVCRSSLAAFKTHMAAVINIKEVTR
jgi:hypothetical protein